MVIIFFLIADNLLRTSFLYAFLQSAKHNVFMRKDTKMYANDFIKIVDTENIVDIELLSKI